MRSLQTLIIGRACLLSFFSYKKSLGVLCFFSLLVCVSVMTAPPPQSQDNIIHRGLWKLAVWQAQSVGRGIIRIVLLYPPTDEGFFGMWFSNPVIFSPKELESSHLDGYWPGSCGHWRTCCSSQQQQIIRTSQQPLSCERCVRNPQPAVPVDSFFRGLSSRSRAKARFRASNFFFGL